MWKDILNKMNIFLCVQQNSFFFSLVFFCYSVEPCACLLWNFPVTCTRLCWYFVLKRTTHLCVVRAKMNILTAGSKWAKGHKMRPILKKNQSNEKKNIYWLWLFFVVHFVVSGNKLQSCFFFTANQSINLQRFVWVQHFFHICYIGFHCAFFRGIDWF